MRFRQEFNIPPPSVLDIVYAPRDEWEEKLAQLKDLDCSVTWPPVVAGATGSACLGAAMIGSTATGWFWGMLVATLMCGYAAWMKRHSVKVIKQSIIAWMEMTERRQRPVATANKP
jgi:hypothetical protein